jgi:integrase/recombinase XerD
MKQLTVTRSEGTKHLFVQHDFDRELYQKLKSLPKIEWNHQKKCWQLPNEPNSIHLLLSEFKGIAWVDLESIKTVQPIRNVPSEEKKNPLNSKNEKTILTALSEDAVQQLTRFENYLKSKRYSARTVKTYSDSLRTFFRFHHDTCIEKLGVEDVIRFNNDYILKNSLSQSFQNQVINAIKLFYRNRFNRSMELEHLHRPRREKRLPNVLSKEEVKAILDAPTNLKHRAMLSLIYACGLRRSELLNLTLKDIHSDRKLLLIRQSKGKKDRVVPLSEKLIAMLREYYKVYKPQHWLFEGQNHGNPYSEKSLENVLKHSIEKAGIQKKVSLHWLRHSYATHLLESGTDLRYIQELLGHSSSRTTEIYTHVSTKNIQQIRTPFDDL